MTETICANFCRMHIFISFRALYFKVSDYGSRMNVGSVSIPASGFSALIWHGLRPQVTPGPGHNTGHSRVQWPRVSREGARRASRDIGAGVLGRDGAGAGHWLRTQDIWWPCLLRGPVVATAVLRPPSPPRSSSASSCCCISRVSSLVSHSGPQSSDTAAGSIRRRSVTSRRGQHQDQDNSQVGEQWSEECGGCCVCVILGSKAEDQIQFWNSRASLCAKLFTLATIGAKYFFNC